MEHEPNRIVGIQADFDEVVAAVQRAQLQVDATGEVGILVAGALHALEQHRARLADDHAAARIFADTLHGAPGIEVAAVETNIVVLTTPDKPAAEPVRRAAAAGVLMNATGKHTLRAVITWMCRRAR
ncbi:MAG: hypothetical protein ABIQ16_02655 [Polyangiaceae bacterium]